jgi:predicted nucleic acid-binding protein
MKFATPRIPAGSPGRDLRFTGPQLETRQYDVALRSEHVKASALSKREILELIEAMEAFAEPVEVVTKIRPLSPDPSDEMILDLAINGRAEALVTSNTRHFAGAGKRFGIPVLCPLELLEKMREGNQDGD